MSDSALSRYTLEELQDAASKVNRDRYPERAVALDAELAKRTAGAGLPRLLLSVRCGARTGWTCYEYPMGELGAGARGMDIPDGRGAAHHSRPHCMMKWLALALLVCFCACAQQRQEWTVPGARGVKVAIKERATDADGYGFQVIASQSQNRRVKVLRESGRMFDADFVDPRFIRFPDRTLMLADYGSEETYGALAWSFERNRVRDLGSLDVDGTKKARVELRDGDYVITVPGPVVLDPQGEHEMRVDESVTFIESYGGLRMAAPARTYSDVHYVEESGDVVGTELTLLLQGEQVIGTLRHFEGYDAEMIRVHGTLAGDVLKVSGKGIALDARLENDVATGTLLFTAGANTLALNLPRQP
jgi:hypothetical protein